MNTKIPYVFDNYVFDAKKEIFLGFFPPDGKNKVLTDKYKENVDKLLAVMAHEIEKEEKCVNIMCYSLSEGIFKKLFKNVKVDIWKRI